MRKYEIVMHVINEEGGWQLSNHPDDPDVATYGGMRFVTYAAWQKRQDRKQISLYNFRKYATTNDPELASRKESLQDGIMECYGDTFYDANRLAELPEILQPAMYSCAVNRGNSNAIKVLQRTFNGFGIQIPLVVDGVIGTKTIQVIQNMIFELTCLNEFIDEWIRDYINIVQANSEAWRDYQLLANKDSMSPPTVLRATFLEGWFNRATSYRYLGK